ncbi:MAG: hypothetical protein VX834_11360, partial [Myxococcota bacterium]|nr:hypothetical protein [Myxococcota bacterium]
AEIASTHIQDYAGSGIVSIMPETDVNAESVFVVGPQIPEEWGIDHFENDTSIDDFENEIGIDDFENDAGMDDFENDAGMDDFENDAGMDDFENDIGIDDFEYSAHSGDGVSVVYGASLSLSDSSIVGSIRSGVLIVERDGWGGESNAHLSSVEIVENQIGVCVNAEFDVDQGLAEVSVEGNGISVSYELVEVLESLEIGSNEAVVEASVSSF